MSVEAGTACIQVVNDLLYTLWAAGIYVPDMVVGDKDRFPLIHDASCYNDGVKILMVISP